MIDLKENFNGAFKKLSKLKTTLGKTEDITFNISYCPYLQTYIALGNAFTINIYDFELYYCWSAEGWIDLEFNIDKNINLSPVLNSLHFKCPSFNISHYTISKKGKIGLYKITENDSVYQWIFNRGYFNPIARDKTFNEWHENGIFKEISTLPEELTDKVLLKKGEY